jgi:hypothetical protein
VDACVGSNGMYEVAACGSSTVGRMMGGLVMADGLGNCKMSGIYLYTDRTRA